MMDLKLDVDKGDFRDCLWIQKKFNIVASDSDAMVKFKVWKYYQHTISHLQET